MSTTVLVMLFVFGIQEIAALVAILWGITMITRKTNWPFYLFFTLAIWGCGSCGGIILKMRPIDNRLEIMILLMQICLILMVWQFRRSFNFAKGTLSGEPKN